MTPAAYRQRLALLWVVWSVVLALLLLVRMVQGDGGALVDWLTPHVAPSLALVTGVATLTQPEAGSELRAAFWRALLLSIAYLLTVTVALLVAMTTLAGHTETLLPFNRLLALFQGGVAASLGVFFAKSSKSA